MHDSSWQASFNLLNSSCIRGGAAVQVVSMMTAMPMKMKIIRFLGFCRAYLDGQQRPIRECQKLVPVEL